MKKSMFKTNETKNYGFTLVELLVVVVIIGVLVGGILTVMNPAQVRGRARDAQRVSDLKILQTALEEFYLKKRYYPASSSFVYVNPASGVLYTNLVSTAATKVLDILPSDPLNDSILTDPCSNTAAHRYNYIAPDQGGGQAQKYVLTSIMESPTSNNGYECGRLTNWVDNATFSANICNQSAGICDNTTGNGISGNSYSFTTCDYCYGVENR
ncbi:MAG: prepilin-type N-terminal cleavage/methylation domain-containing protein [Patescibacteria group bacterium]